MPEDQAVFGVFSKPAVPPDNIAIVAGQIEAEARDLAKRVTAGEFEALSVDARCNLRTLSLAMAGWADDLRTEVMEREAERHVARIGRPFGRRMLGAVA